MQLRRCYTGHGPTIEHHRALIDERFAFHSDRLDRIAALVASGHRTAFEVARQLWSEDVAISQPVLVTWEVLGHLDVLVTVAQPGNRSMRRAYTASEARRIARRWRRPAVGANGPAAVTAIT